MTTPLKLALIGAGHMGKFHAQAIVDRTDAKLVAVCDVEEARAAAIAGPVGARVVTDVRQLVGQIDAAVIAAATSVHLAVAVPLMEAGVAVLIEKPVAPTTREAREIADAARRTGAVAQVGQILRFDPVTRAIAGLGVRPRFIEVSWATPFSYRSRDVGVIMDLMIHGLDLVLHLAGEMPDRVDASAGIVFGPHEDFVSARLAFPSGCAATLTASRMSRTRQRIVRVFSDGAYLKLDYAARTVDRIATKPGVVEAIRAGQQPGGALEDLVIVEKLPVEAQPDALRAQLASFLDAVRGKHPSAVTIEDGARAVEVAERVVGCIKAQMAV